MYDMLEEIIQTRVSQQVKAALEEAARREGRSPSEILRLLVTDWLQRSHPGLLERGTGGGVRAMEANPVQTIAPTQPVYPVLCWRCRGWINWRVDLGPQGWCPYCSAFIDIRVK